MIVWTKPPYAVDPERLTPAFQAELERFADFIERRWSWRLIAHYGVEGEHKAKTHADGCALDAHVEDARGQRVHWLAAYLEAERFHFTGLGVYPYWKTAGLHLDVRGLKDPHEARWAQDKAKEYIALTYPFIQEVLLEEVQRSMRGMPG